jgi:hypothetical protein
LPRSDLAGLLLRVCLIGRSDSQRLGSLAATKPKWLPGEAAAADEPSHEAFTAEKIVARSGHPSVIAMRD